MSEDALMDDHLLDMVTPLPYDENGDNIPLITEIPEDDGQMLLADMDEEDYSNQLISINSSIIKSVQEQDYLEYTPQNPQSIQLETIKNTNSLPESSLFEYKEKLHKHSNSIDVHVYVQNVEPIELEINSLTEKKINDGLPAYDSQEQSQLNKYIGNRDLTMIEEDAREYSISRSIVSHFQSICTNNIPFNNQLGSILMPSDSIVSGISKSQTFLQIQETLNYNSNDDLNKFNSKTKDGITQQFQDEQENQIHSFNNQKLGQQKLKLKTNKLPKSLQQMSARQQQSIPIVEETILENDSQSNLLSSERLDQPDQIFWQKSESTKSFERKSKIKVESKPHVVPIYIQKKGVIKQKSALAIKKPLKEQPLNIKKNGDIVVVDGELKTSSSRNSSVSNSKLSYQLGYSANISNQVKSSTQSKNKRRLSPALQSAMVNLLGERRDSSRSNSSVTPFSIVSQQTKTVGAGFNVQKSVTKKIQDEQLSQKSSIHDYKPTGKNIVETEGYESLNKLLELYQQPKIQQTTENIDDSNSEEIANDKKMLELIYKASHQNSETLKNENWFTEGSEYYNLVEGKPPRVSKGQHQLIKILCDDQTSQQSSRHINTKITPFKEFQSQQTSFFKGDTISNTSRSNQEKDSSINKQQSTPQIVVQQQILSQYFHLASQQPKEQFFALVKSDDLQQSQQLTKLIIPKNKNASKKSSRNSQTNVQAAQTAYQTASKPQIGRKVSLTGIKPNKQQVDKLKKEKSKTRNEQTITTDQLNKNLLKNFRSPARIQEQQKTKSKIRVNSPVNMVPSRKSLVKFKVQDDKQFGASQVISEIDFQNATQSIVGNAFFQSQIQNQVDSQTMLNSYNTSQKLIPTLQTTISSPSLQTFQVQLQPDSANSIQLSRSTSSKQNTLGLQKLQKQKTVQEVTQLVFETKNHKLQLEWRNLCKMLSQLNNREHGYSINFNDLKYKQQFSKNEVTIISAEYRKRLHSQSELLQQYQIKISNLQNENQSLINEIKVNKQLQQLQENETNSTRKGIALLAEACDELKKVMIQNIVFLEFQKDLKNIQVDPIKQFQSIENELEILKQGTMQDVRNLRKQWIDVGENNIMQKLNNLQEKHSIFKSDRIPKKEDAVYEVILEQVQSFILKIQAFLNNKSQIFSARTYQESTNKIPPIQNFYTGTFANQIQVDSSLNLNHLQDEVQKSNTFDLLSNRSINQQINNGSVQRQMNSQEKSIIKSECSKFNLQGTFSIEDPTMLGSISQSRNCSKHSRKSVILSPPGTNKKGSTIIQPPMVMGLGNGNCGISILSGNSRTIFDNYKANSLSARNKLQGARTPHHTNTRIKNSKEILINDNSIYSQERSSFDKSQGIQINKVLDLVKAKQVEGENQQTLVYKVLAEISVEDKLKHQLQKKEQKYQDLLSQYQIVCKQAKIENIFNESNLSQPLFSDIKSQSYFNDNQEDNSLNRQHFHQIHWLQQQNKKLQLQIEDYTLALEIQHNLLQNNNQLISQLESAVIAVCHKNITSSGDLSSNEKKLLKAIFGDGFLINNKLRQDIQKLKDISSQLLCEIVLEMFNYLDESNSQKNMKYERQPILQNFVKSQDSIQQENTQFSKMAFTLEKNKAERQQFNLFLDDDIQISEPLMQLISSQNKGSGTQTVRRHQSANYTPELEQPKLGLIEQLKSKLTRLAQQYEDFTGMDILHHKSRDHDWLKNSLCKHTSTQPRKMVSRLRSLS